MKRRRLQALCKKHGIPANSTNLEMADRLTSLVKGTNALTSVGQSCSINSLGETAIGKKSIDEIRKVKKVRFNPDTEVRYYVVSVKRRGRRRSMVKKPAQENPVKLSEETVDNTSRITRSRAQNAVEGEANKILASVRKKRRRKGIKGGNEVENYVDRDNLGLTVVELCSNAVKDGHTKLSRRKLRNGEVEDGKSGDKGGEDQVVSMENMLRRSSRKRVKAKCGDEVLLLNSASEGNYIAYGDAKLGVFNGDSCGVGEGNKNLASVGKKRGRNGIKGGNAVENSVNRDMLVPPAVEICSNVVEDGDAKLSRRKLRNGEIENGKSGDEGEEDLVVSRKNMPRRCFRKRGNAKGGHEVLLVNSASEGNKIAYGDAKLGILNVDSRGVEAAINVIEVHKKVIEFSKVNDKISQPSDLRRRSRHNVAVLDTTAPSDETARGTKKKRELLPDREVYVTEVSLRRSSRNPCRHKSIATSNKVNGIVDGAGKEKQSKRRGESILKKETVSTEHGPSVEKPSKRITCNVSKCNLVSAAVLTDDTTKNQQQSTFGRLIIGHKSSDLDDVHIAANCDCNLFSRDGTRDDVEKLDDGGDFNENSKRWDFEEVKEIVVINEQVASKIDEEQHGEHEHREDRYVKLENNHFIIKEKLDYGKDKILEEQVNVVTGTKHAILSGLTVQCDLDHPKDDFAEFIVEKMGVVKLTKEVSKEDSLLREMDPPLTEDVDQSPAHITSSAGIAAEDVGRDCLRLNLGLLPQKNSTCLQKEENSVLSE